MTLTPGFWWKIHHLTSTSTIVEVLETPAGRKVRNFGQTGMQFAVEEPLDDEGYFYKMIEPVSLAELYEARWPMFGKQRREDELKGMVLDELVAVAQRVKVPKTYKTPGLLRKAILRAEGF